MLPVKMKREKKQIMGIKLHIVKYWNNISPKIVGHIPS